MLIAQISDLHVRREGRPLHYLPDTVRALRRVLGRLESLRPRPDLIVATGDLTDGGHPEEYARLRAELERSTIPIRLLPGNHDDRDALRAAFPEHDYLGAAGSHASYVVEGPLRIIALDTTEPGRGGGVLDVERITWLEARLAAAPTTPTLIATHHPPYRTGTPLDLLGFPGADAFATVVRRHPQVARVISGHVHRAATTRWASTLASTAPSTAAHVTLRPIGPLAVLSFETAGYALHHLVDGALRYRVVRLRDDRRRTQRRQRRA